jgi:hypothetical protein
MEGHQSIPMDQIKVQEYEEMSRQLNLLAKEAGIVRKYQQKMSLYNREMLI